MVHYKVYLESRTGQQIFILHLGKEATFLSLLKITSQDREAIKSIPHPHIRAILLLILWDKTIKALKAINEALHLLIHTSLSNLHSIIISLTSHLQSLPQYSIKEIMELNQDLSALPKSSLIRKYSLHREKAWVATKKSSSAKKVVE